MQKQALFSLVLIASMMATASAGITSDKKEANYSESADLEQTLPVGAEKVYSSTSSNNRNFGASGFVASHVRMGQLDEFKSIIEDVVTNGGPLQSSLLNAENYGLPVHGSSYLHMKTNDNRIKTVFDSPPPGFVSSNKQVNSGISDSAGPEIVLDKGVCAITLNLDDKVVDHDRMILSWADHMIGEEHSNEGGRMHVYISTPNDPSRGKKIVDAPLNYIAGKDGSPLQLSKDQATFKTSGMNRRAVDLGSYINQKILMELFVVDKDNNPVDIGCALDDFHWESSNDPRVVQSTTAKLNRPSKRHLNILDNTLEQNPKTRDVEKSFNNEGPSREEMSGFPVSVTANGQIRDLEHDSEGAIYSPPKNRLSIPNSNVITSQKSGPESQLHPSTHSLKEEDETMDASKDGNRASSGLLSSFSKYLFAAKSKGQNFPSSTTKSPTSDELSESARDPNIIPTGSSSELAAELEWNALPGAEGHPRFRQPDVKPEEVQSSAQTRLDNSIPILGFPSSGSGADPILLPGLPTIPLGGGGLEPMGGQNQNYRAQSAPKESEMTQPSGFSPIVPVRGSSIKKDQSSVVSSQNIPDQKSSKSQIPSATGFQAPKIEKKVENQRPAEEVNQALGNKQSIPKKTAENLPMAGSLDDKKPNDLNGALPGMSKITLPETTFGNSPKSSSPQFGSLDGLTKSKDEPLSNKPTSGLTSKPVDIPSGINKPATPEFIPVLPELGSNRTPLDTLSGSKKPQVGSPDGVLSGSKDESLYDRPTSGLTSAPLDIPSGINKPATAKSVPVLPELGNNRAPLDTLSALSKPQAGSPEGFFPGSKDGSLFDKPVSGITKSPLETLSGSNKPQAELPKEALPEINDKSLFDKPTSGITKAPLEILTGTNKLATPETVPAIPELGNNRSPLDALSGLNKPLVGPLDGIRGSKDELPSGTPGSGSSNAPLDGFSGLTKPQVELPTGPLPLIKDEPLSGLTRAPVEIFSGITKPEDDEKLGGGLPVFKDEPVEIPGSIKKPSTPTVPEVEIPTIGSPQPNDLLSGLPNPLKSLPIPEFEVPKVEIPNVEVPKVEFPSVETTKAAVPAVPGSDKGHHIPSIPSEKIPKVLGEIPIIGTPRLPLPPLLPHPTRPHGPHHSSTVYSDMRRAAAAILKSRMIHPKCPEGMRACPAPKKKALGMMPEVLRKMVKDDEWECMEVNELVSCGGCTSEGTGVDCTKLPGVDGVGCEDLKCKIFTCLDSHMLNNGKCEPKKD